MNRLILRPVRAIGSRFTLVVASMAVFGLASAADTATAQDTIVYKDGQTYPSSTGTQRIEVTEETYSVIKYDIKTGGGSLSQDVSTSRVAEIRYARKVADYDEAKALFDAGDYDGAIDAFAPLPERRSPHWLKPYSLFHIAESHFRMGDAEGALAAFENFLSEEPQHRFVPKARLRIGESQLRMKKLDEARTTFTSLRRDVDAKGFDPAYRYRAELGLIGIDEAKGAWSTVLSSLQKLQAEVGDEYPDVANEAKLKIGNAYISDGQYKKAEDYFQAIIDGENPSKDVLYGAYVGLGNAYFAQSRFEEALKDCFLRVVVMNDRDGDVSIERLAPALYWSGRCFDQLRGEKPENGAFARDLYAEVVRTAPGSQWAEEARKLRRR